MKTIVALVDFSDGTEKVLDQAGKFAKLFGARVVILHVVPKEAVVVDFGLLSPTVLKAPPDEVIKADYARLLELQESLTQSGVDTSVQQFRDGSAEKILVESRRLNADMIIMASNHHSAVYNWFMGTLTSDVLKSAGCPVLVVPPAGWEDS